MDSPNPLVLFSPNVYIGVACICGGDAVGDSSDVGQFNWATHKTRSQKELEVTSEQMWRKGVVSIRHSLQFHMMAMQLWRLAGIILVAPRVVQCLVSLGCRC